MNKGDSSFQGIDIFCTYHKANMDGDGDVCVCAHGMFPEKSAVGALRLCFVAVLASLVGPAFHCPCQGSRHGGELLWAWQTWVQILTLSSDRIHWSDYLPRLFQVHFFSLIVGKKYFLRAYCGLLTMLRSLHILFCFNPPSSLLR